MLYIIQFSESIDIKSILLVVDGAEDYIYLKQPGVSPPVYSLINGKLERKISKEWNCEIFTNKFLSKTKSNYDSRWAALYALLCAKSKQYETERFLYLWMSLNGMYGFMSNKISPPKENNNKTPSESRQLSYFLQLYNLGTEHIAKKDSTRIANEVKSIIGKTDLLSVKSNIDFTKKFIGDIEKVITKSPEKNNTNVSDNQTIKYYDINAYGYLLISFAYYFRCNLFHGDKPILILAYKDETEIKCLKLINLLLEEFIDQNLYKYFDDEYLENNFGKKIEEIKNKKK